MRPYLWHSGSQAALLFGAGTIPHVVSYPATPIFVLSVVVFRVLALTGQELRQLLDRHPLVPDGLDCGCVLVASNCLAGLASCFAISILLAQFSSFLRLGSGRGLFWVVTLRSLAIGLMLAQDTWTGNDGRQV